MTSTDHEPALLRAVLDDPADGLPRLAYADLMEERGEDARAEFVRVQLELDRSPDDAELRDRELHLLGRHWPHWVKDETGRSPYYCASLWPAPPCPTPHVTFRRGFVERVEMATADFLAHAKALFSRHPITEVVLVDREPMPNSGGGCSWWDLARVADRVHPASNVPSAIFSHLSSGESVDENLSRSYPDEAAALADLSRACVRHGRALAGLGEWEGVR